MRIDTANCARNTLIANKETVKNRTILLITKTTTSIGAAKIFNY
jgi:hypothetical protein